MKNRWQKPLVPALVVGLFAMGMALILGCEDTTEYGKYEPPAGQGSLVVDNDTADTLHVYVNGGLRLEVDGYETDALYLTTGVYRVVITAEGGGRDYRGDQDVLTNQITVLHVRDDVLDSDDYDVEQTFE